MSSTPEGHRLQRHRAGAAAASGKGLSAKVRGGPWGTVLETREGCGLSLRHGNVILHPTEPDLGLLGEHARRQ